MEKKKIIYGVEMTLLEEMQFAKYRDNKGIAMNTLTEKERFELTNNWKNGKTSI
jgi:hypothetical protein